MNSNGILHLTVCPKGIVSMWDTPQLAAAGKQPHEVQVQVALTKSQMALVLRAEALARSKAGIK